MVTAAHLRVRSDPGARTWLLVLAIASAVVVLLTFLFTTLVDEPASLVTLAAIIALSVGIGPTWRQRRARAEPATGATA